MKPNPHDLTYKLLAELGVSEPSVELAAEVEDHFAKIILEVFLRRLPPEKLPAIEKLMAGKDPGALEVYVTEEAAAIPGLAEEIEAAITREYEMMKSAISSPSRGQSQPSAQ